MDYYEIGQRIRRIRKARGLSQEELAAKVSISTTHMSHIETANTKLSLPVFIDIAAALDVQTDALLSDSPTENRSSLSSEINKVLEQCDKRQLRIILDLIKTAHQSLTIYESGQ